MDTPEFFQLENRDQQLRITLMNPEHHPRWYSGQRFSAAGFITRVEFRGHDYFYHPGGDGRFQKGLGIPMEFDLGERFEPPGYQEANPGENFLKIGVGVLPKPDKPKYHFGIPYEVQEFPLRKQNVEKSQAIFLERLAQGTRGYSYQLATLLQVESERLTIRYELTNSGDRPFVTEQYLHNFTALDPSGLNEDLELEFPFDFELNSQPFGLNCQGILNQSGRKMRFSGIELDQRCVKLPVIATPEALKRHRLTITDHRNHRKLVIGGSTPVNQWSFFLSAEQISPEAFVKIAVAPGETFRWHRTYDFS